MVVARRLELLCCVVGEAGEAEDGEQVRYVAAETKQAEKAWWLGREDRGHPHREVERPGETDRLRWTDRPALREELWLLAHQGQGLPF